MATNKTLSAGSSATDSDPSAGTRLRLIIDEKEYLLQEQTDGEWSSLAALAGGANALLGSYAAMNEAALEAVIERAEDWLMPQAARMKDRTLDVVDRAGRLAPGLSEVLAVQADRWDVDGLERLFLQVLELTTGRYPAAALQGRPAFVADIVLLRELAHHGRLREVRSGVASL